jgi:hypothetical protein
MAIREMLYKISSALKQAKATAGPSLQPKLIGEGWAVPTGPGTIEKIPQGLEKFDTDDGFRERRVRRKFFKN